MIEVLRRDLVHHSKMLDIEYVCVGNLGGTAFIHLYDALDKLKTDVQEYLQMGYRLQGGVSVCRVEENFCVVQTIIRDHIDDPFVDYGSYSE